MSARVVCVLNLADEVRAYFEYLELMGWEVLWSRECDGGRCLKICFRY